MKLKGLVLALSLSSLAGAALAGSVKVEDGMSLPESSYNVVNKSVTIGSNSEIRDVQSVNGSIRIGSGSIVRDINSVNGGIKIRSAASAKSIESVNGAVDLADDVMITHSVETVNGRIRIDSGGSVGEDVSTVNGTIKLTGSTVQGDVKTYNGDMQLEQSEVFGDLRVSKPRGFNWKNKKPKPNRIVIGADTVIHGDLYFERAVELTVHPSATIGRVIGNEVERGDMR